MKNKNRKFFFVNLIAFLEEIKSGDLIFPYFILYIYVCQN